MKVKICGIRNESDLIAALNAGADAVGFITEVPVDSPRKIGLAEASRLISKVPVFVTSVLVIMPENAEQAIKMIHATKPAAVQIHNDMELSELRKIKETGVKLIKTLHISLDEDLNNLIKHLSHLNGIADAVLLDTAVEGKTGGTGMTHNWKLSSELVLRAGMPVILAGGLDPENVRDAIKAARPYAVDVASGVETDGRKDEKKVQNLVNNAKGYV